MLKEFDHKANIHRRVRPGQVPGSSGSILDLVPCAGRSLHRQLQERLVDIQAMYVVTPFSPNHALRPGSASDVRHVEYVFLTVLLPEDPQRTIPDRSKPIVGVAALARFRVVVIKLLVARVI
jgi:hypothetical protein